MTTTSTTSQLDRPLKIDDILRAVETLKKIPRNTKWVVVNPEGQMFVGEYQEVAPHFLMRHPFFSELRLNPVPYMDATTKPSAEPESKP